MNPKWRRLCFFTCLAVIATFGAGCACSVLGKRETKDSWQLGVVNFRSFEDGEGAYLFAIYDGNLPAEDSMSLLQLWSGEKKKEE